MNKIPIILLILIVGIYYYPNLFGALSHDEVLHIQTADSIVHGKDMYIWADHPKFAQWFITIGLVFMDWSPFGAKLSSFIFSLLTLFLVYKIVTLLSNKYFGFVAVLIVSLLNIFQSLAVVALLDMTFTFLVILLCYIMLRYLSVTQTNRYLIYLGVVSSALIFTKYYGVFFGIASLSFIVYKERSNLKTLKYFVVAFIIMFLLIYIPYLHFDKENIEYHLISDRTNPNNHYASSDLLLLLPYFPSVFYLFARSAGAMLMLTSNAPNNWFGYIDLILNNGGFFYLMGTVISIIVLMYLYSQRKVSTNILFLVIYTIVPLVFFSGVSVKSPKYLLPFFVLFTILIVIMIYKARKLDFKLKFGIYLCMIFLIALPLPPVFYQSTNVDSRYDVAAHKVIDYVAASNKTEIYILVSAPHVLEYYLERQQGVNITVVNNKTVNDFIRSFELKITIQNRMPHVYLISYEFNSKNPKLYNIQYDLGVLLKEQRDELKFLNQTETIYIYKNKYIG